MPMSAPKPCTAPGCGVLVRDGTSRCSSHQRPAWAKKPDATKRITGSKLRAMRANLFRRHPLCVHCEAQGRVVLATQRDHIIPLADGGADDDTNVQGLCVECHAVKSKAESARGRNGGVRAAVLPNFLPVSTVPVVVVCGPPGSGKSTYAQEQALPSDLVIDVDVIAARLSGKPLYHADHDERMLAIRERNRILGALGRAVPYTKVWLITTAGTQQQRDFWSTKYGPLTIMPTSKDVCIARIEADTRRPVLAKLRAIEAVRSWQ